MATTARDLGREVDPTPSARPDNSHTLRGEYVTLERFDKTHISSLWQHLQFPQHAYLLDYIPFQVPESEEEMWPAFSKLLQHRDFIFYAIKADPVRLNAGEKDKGKESHSEVLGVISYLSISPQHRDIEVGFVLFGPALQRTTAATEAHYLMLKNVCERDSPGLGGSSLPYRRVVWKCNHLNTSSRRAAERLGYIFEGTFRNHLIVKGRSRDTGWLSIVEDEWPVVKAALEKWLDATNFDENGSQIKALDKIRAEMK